MKKSIRQSTLTLILNLGSVVLIALSTIAFFFIIQHDRDVEKANKMRYELTFHANVFMDGSGYLTDEVRAYAATGNRAHYTNYKKEVLEAKTLNISVRNMRRIGMTATEEELVEKMFAISNKLIPLEEEAMRLSEAGKRAEALDIVYGRTYTDLSSSIRRTQINFVAELNRRTELHLAVEQANMRNWIVITVACLSLTVLIQAISTVVIRRKVIRPLVKVRDEMLRIARGNLHSKFNAEPDTSEIGMLIGSIQSTKRELNKYISDITEKLRVIAGGDLNARVEIDYIGDFAEIKRAINEIAQILAEQHERNQRGRLELEEACVAANEASRAKSSFLSNMSHEIRTPMNAIIGMTNIALASNGIERKDYCLGKVNDASRHLLGVINDILDMSKIDANKFELAPCEFNLEEMLIRVASIINFRIDEKHQRLGVRLGREVPPILVADEQRLAQVITNLLANASKFTPEEGRIILEVRVSELDATECELEFSVKDSGIGISPEQQKKLFNYFTQADAGISRKYGGTGLGLAISKGIVEKMGGNIRVESEEGKGSTFSFTIKAGYNREEATKIRARGAIRWDEVRVLVVDDEAPVREYFMDIAEWFGFNCETAADGLSALEKISHTGGYDIYFIDWKMPGMDGLELAQKITGQLAGQNNEQSRDREPGQEDGAGQPAGAKQENSLARPTVIMISSADWSRIEQEAQKAGITRYITKPLFPSVIADMIAGCLGEDLRTHKAVAKELPDFSGRHILLAEDVEINCEIVVSLLEPTGVQITCVPDGLEAVRAVAENPGLYDMVFMDMQMPKMDGSEAARRIRTLDDACARNIPIVAMTANVFREDVERCFEAGMNDHIGKPLNFDEVITKMEKYFPAGKCEHQDESRSSAL